MNGESKETMGRWKHGDKVWYRNTGGFETQLELLTVVAENEGVVWVKDELEDKLVFSHKLTAFTKEDKEKKSTLDTLYALLNQTSLSKEEIGEVCGMLLGAGVTFDEEIRDEIG